VQNLLFSRTLFWPSGPSLALLIEAAVCPTNADPFSPLSSGEPSSGAHRGCDSANSLIALSALPCLDERNETTMTDKNDNTHTGDSSSPHSPPQSVGKYASHLPASLRARRRPRLQDDLIRPLRPRLTSRTPLAMVSVYLWQEQLLLQLLLGARRRQRQGTGAAPPATGAEPRPAPNETTRAARARAPFSPRLPFLPRARTPHGRRRALALAGGRKRGCCSRCDCERTFALDGESSPLQSMLAPRGGDFPRDTYIKQPDGGRKDDFKDDFLSGKKNFLTNQSMTCPRCHA